jgi:hypothetical protein
VFCNRARLHSLLKNASGEKTRKGATSVAPPMTQMDPGFSPCGVSSAESRAVMKICANL